MRNHPLAAHGRATTPPSMLAGLSRTPHAKAPQIHVATNKSPDGIVTSMTLDRRNAAFSHEELPITLLFLVLSVAALAYVYGLELPFGAPPIGSDGFGYNAYLPAFFLDHDLTFRTMITRLSASKDPLASNGEINMWSGIVPYKDTGLYIDIYPIGSALLQTPFFLAADLIGKVFGLSRFAPTTTYPPIFQIANVASSTAYF